MCGISGILCQFPTQNISELVEAMNRQLIHRGPDAAGQWTDRSNIISLGHRRLSILGLGKNGNQPMLSKCGRFVIIFNGEIYNYREITKELSLQNLVSGSDTEVLLEAISKTIFTNNEELFKQCKLLARHGQDENKVFQIAGFNSRLDEIQAAILNVKLDNFDKEIQLRQNVAEMYRESFSKYTSEIIIPFIKSDMVSAYAQYTIKFIKSSPESIQKKLKADGIPSVSYYTPPVHLHPAYHHHASKLDVTEMISRQTLSLPFHPYMTYEEIKLISESVIRAL